MFQNNATVILNCISMSYITVVHIQLASAEIKSVLSTLSTLIFVILCNT